MIDVLGKNLWYNTEFFGAGMKAPWLTIGPLITLSGGATCLMYFTELVMEEEDHYFKRQVFNALQCVLFFGCVGFACDGGLWLMDKEWYCQLQKESVMDQCETRNKLLTPSMIVWFLIGVPIVYQFN